MCYKYYHLLCAEHGKQTVEYLKIMKSLKGIFTCRQCMPNGTSTRIAPVDPNEDPVRIHEKSIFESRLNMITLENKKLIDEITFLKQRNTQLVMDKTQTPSVSNEVEVLVAEKEATEVQLDTLKADIETLIKVNNEQEKQIQALLNTSRAMPANKRPREVVVDLDPAPRAERSLSEQRTPMQATDSQILSMLKSMQKDIVALKSDVGTIKVAKNVGFELPPYPRNRSSSRGRQPIRSQTKRTPSKNRNTQPDLTRKSFAEVVSSTKSDNIRNIKIMSNEPDRLNEINTSLEKIHLVDVQIESIARKAGDFITVKCSSASDAVKMEDTLKKRFGENLKISGVKMANPQVKIVNVGINEYSDNDNFIIMLKEQNHWLKNLFIEVAEVFSVPGNRTNYSNAILNCDLESLKMLLEKGSVICGFAEKSVYEHVQVLQCFNCQRFGHVAANCTADPVCKYCSRNHSSNLCEDKALKICSNCTRENTVNGAKYNTNHRSSDERCPCRSARIAALKKLASKN